MIDSACFQTLFYLSELKRSLYFITKNLEQFINNYMKCQYCPSPAKGINYKPSNGIENAPACLEHRTTLFIHFQNDGNSESVGEDGFLQELLNTVIGQYNLLKSELSHARKQMA